MKGGERSSPGGEGVQPPEESAGNGVGRSRNMGLASFLVRDTAMLLQTGLEQGWLQTIVSDQTIC